MMKKCICFCFAILGLVSCRKPEDVSHFISAQFAELSANKIGLSESGNALTMNVSSNIYWVSEIDSDWLEMFPVAGYGEQTQVTFALKNNDGPSRSTTVKLYAVDGTSTSFTVEQSGTDELINYLSLDFYNSFANYKGIGSAPVCVEGDGYVIQGNGLIFGEDAFVTVGPVQPRQGIAFSLSIDAEGDGMEVYVNNRKELKNKLSDSSFYFDDLTSFYVCMTAPVGTVLKGLVIDEGKEGQGQYIHFGDGKPVDYVYFSDDFKWLSVFSDVDFISTLDNTSETLWKLHTSESGFNPKGWTLSDNSLKQRVYIHSNCLKFGRGANTAGSGGGIITPCLDVPEGFFTNVEVKVLACAYYPGKNSNFDAESALLIRVIGDGEIQNGGSSSITVNLDLTSEKKAIWDSSNIEYRKNNVWEEYNINILGVSSNTRIAIESLVETTKGRMLIGGVTIKKVKI